MFDRLRLMAAGGDLGLVGLALARARPPGPPSRPRPGLTAQQTKEAVNLAKGAMVELRKKTEGASTPGADLREYIVGVELLAPRNLSSKRENRRGSRRGRAPQAKPEQEEKQQEKAKGPGRWPSSPRIATSTTSPCFRRSTGAGRVVKVEAAQHLRTPLSDGEFEEAKRWRVRRATR